VVRVHLVIDAYNDESGRQRAERDVELPAVPRIGESISVARMLTLKVAYVTWMLDEGRPWLFLGRAEGTTSSIKDLDGELEVPQNYVDDLVKGGWRLSPE
jgi:hypothetical protein